MENGILRTSLIFFTELDKVENTIKFLLMRKLDDTHAMSTIKKF